MSFVFRNVTISRITLDLNGVVIQASIQHPQMQKIYSTRREVIEQNRGK